MTKALNLTIPQYDAVEIVFLPRETLLGGRNTGLNAWLCCVPCGSQYEQSNVSGFWKCDACGCDISKAEIIDLIQAYRQQLDSLVAVISPPPKKRPWWLRIFGKTNG